MDYKLRLVLYFYGMKKLYLLLSVVLLLASCNTNQKKNQEEKIPTEQNNGIGDGAPSLSTAFANTIESTHNKEAFLNKNNVSFDISLNFNGEERLAGTFIMRTNSSKVKYITKDSTTIIYDGKDVYMSPENSNMKSARFDILTWPYFFALPFKLTDPGTVWGDVEQISEKNKSYSRAKLSFKNDVGDTSDDWYQVYADNETNLLNYASYIVTFGKSLDKAEENPHAILYENYQVIDGVAISDKWKFYNWSEEKGLFGEPLGEAKLTNIKFVESVDYTVPENASEVKLPTTK